MGLVSAWMGDPYPVSYTHLRAHETGRNLVCRLLLEKKNKIVADLLNLEKTTEIKTAHVTGFPQFENTQ